ncbi:MAG TPA: cupin domain-containing protein [Sandaracinaceae bacterium LLY-WYZ-13_1]|nr:cupin domain-containing protein [Sandaracinaceae bacterium LLY-WYZ-13_1]
MLEAWLDDTTIQDFVLHVRGRRPTAGHGTASEAIPLFDWASVDRILDQDALDLSVRRGGRPVEAAPPRGLDALRGLFAMDVGLVVRHAERADPGLAALARSFTRDLSGPTRLELTATPAGDRGHGWHYDADERFVVVTEGFEQHYFRANTVAPEPVRGAPPDFARIREERSPMSTCLLAPGDWLYLPRGWWHTAQADEDTLAISIGVAPGIWA